MIIKETNYSEYLTIIPRGLFFNSAEFNQLNAYKVDSVRYFLFQDHKVRFGLCVGQKGLDIFCPFSAPFSSFVNIRNDWELSQLEAAVECLEEFARKESWSKICFTLPPYFYNEGMIAALQNILLRNGYRIKYFDLNYQFNFKDINYENYMQTLSGKARNKLKISLKCGLQIRHCNTDAEKKHAYEIIMVNRKSKGYPLRMSFEQVTDTIKLVKHDFFIVEKDLVKIAAAQVFYVTDKIAQVIYWGDIPGFSDVKPMNYLAYQMVQYYGKNGFDFLDIGPATESGIPNYGLCSFKSSIGCSLSSKVTVEKIWPQH